MRLGIFYHLSIDNKNKAALPGIQASFSNTSGKRRIYKQGLFLAVSLLMSICTKASTLTFVNGAHQYDTICANGSANISDLLAVNDLSGDTVICTVAYGPYHGSVSGLPDTGVVGFSSGGAPIMYTPNTGYSGTDGLVIRAKDNLGNVTYTHIHFMVNPQPALTPAILATSVCSGATSATISFTALTNVGADTVRLTMVGDTIWTVPVGITSLNFDVQGARGGRDNVSSSVGETPDPGYGDRILGTLSVTEGEQLNLFIGGKGGDGTDTGATGGYNGGGNAYAIVFGSGGGGGGASDIRIGGTALSNRVVVAGGGGGNGWDDPGPLSGGAGGGTTGGSSALNRVGNYAGGGSQIAGGAGATYTPYAPGMNGSLDTGGNGSSDGVSGGGGGGYYGGGGGVWTGGGGGSSYANPGLTALGIVTNTPGYDTSDGQIRLSYVIPGTYSIVWDSAAHSVGFRDTSAVPLPLSAFMVAVPYITDSTGSTTYSGTLTVSSATCMSPGYPINITINPVPFVSITPNQAVCNGDSISSGIVFTGTSGATFNWANNNTGIGLGPYGTGKIFGFIPTNSGTMPSVATITVTPTESGCPGTPKTFTITDNPIPVLGSTLFPAATCDSMPFNYNPTSARDTAVSFAWSRAAIPGITNAAGSGMGSINDTLVNTTDTTIAVAYQYILNYMGCGDTQNVTERIYPHPRLTNSLMPPAVCSNTPFMDTATTNVMGTVVTWSRPAMTGISNASANGSDSIINEVLTDTTSSPVIVVYTDTLNFNNYYCVYTQAITVTVNPTPMLSTPLVAPTTCGAVMYVAGSTVGGTSFEWSRDTTGGISTAAASGAGATINEGLTNTVDSSIVVTYTYTLTANGCANSENITDTIKPTPKLISTLTPDSICSNTVFTYSATSSIIPGTTYAWSRGAIAGISNPSSSATINEIVEVLIDTTTNIIPVTYVYTLTAMGCTNTENVVVSVDPTPMLSYDPQDTSICDNTLFSFTPGSATAGALFTWTRAYVTGIDDLPGSGTGNISESLNNTTYVNVDVTYQYTIAANGCSNTEDVILAVHPNPTLSSDTAATVCSGNTLTYFPTSYTPTTSYAWSLVSTPGVTATSNNGTGAITDTLTSSSSTSTNVTYVYTLTAYGCTNMQDVTVLLQPAGSVSAITTFPSASECDNTMYQNFGTIPPAAGIVYTWVADNAEVYAVGADNQYCLVNFNSPGTATVYLLTNISSTGCYGNASFQATVSNTNNINPQVIYVNGEFICKTTDVDSYQWGYDDATSLDSAVIVGETNQNYFNPAPDATKFYWVMTTNGSCLQKSYYIVPPATTGVANVPAGQGGMTIYPNPAAESINVDISTSTGMPGGTNFRIDVLNIMGQSVSSVTTTAHSTKIDVAGLPAGCYLVDCYNDGVKIATSKFIKN